MMKKETKKTAAVIGRSAIPPEVIQELSQSLDRLLGLLKPYGSAIPAEQGAQYSVTNPESLSADIDPGKFRGHVENSRNLLSIRTKVKALFDLIGDTFISEGCKAFQAVRVYVPGAD
jgi:hypothetical protein